MKTAAHKFSELREKLKTARGKKMWRSMDELAEDSSFQEFLHREFPENASEFTDAVSRRNFLKLMGASFALAGLTACTRQPIEKIVPHVRAPEEIAPGKPLYFATSMCIDCFAKGLLVESHMGRPTKIEGNPEHPASLGATDIFAQASILSLYDPHRSKIILREGKPDKWENCVASWRSELDASNAGEGICLLTETITSPSLAAHIEQFLNKFPNASWHQYNPVTRDNIREGTSLAFGEIVEPQYHFDRAEIILSLDGDFLFAPPGALRYARDFISKRRVHSDQAEMNRLYVVEGFPTVTGSMADHRLPVRSSEIERFAWSLLAKLKAPDTSVTADPSKEWSNWISALADDLQNENGRTLIYPGEFQSPHVHALAHLLNLTLGNVGNTVFFTEPAEAHPENQIVSLRELLKKINAGGVKSLFILGGNPVYNAPADLQFAEALSKVGQRIHLGLYRDETSARCTWHIPAAHYLESWGDARAFDGTTSFQQPLIEPLYGGKTPSELIASLLGENETSGYEILRNFWKNKTRGDFEKWWRKSLHDGFVADTALPEKKITASVESILSRLARNTEPIAIENETSKLEILFRPDSTIRDGEFFNNGWLQELPKPLTQLTWDNAVFISPRFAEKNKLTNEEVVEITLRNESIRAPVWILPGHADDCATLTFGYGRRHFASAEQKLGYNAFALRHSSFLWASEGATIRKTGERYKLACTQNHQSMEGRDLVRIGTLDEFKRKPDFAQEKEQHVHASLYPPFKYESYAWGMSIDLNSCIGCNACTIACQSENNIPIVGKDEVRRGREMHWIRVDRYFSGSLENPTMYHQPVPCMHCENAPCEVVCPVLATTHSAEGLNEMAYNRCIGTRYCSNNCPYKVRRFNFLQYADQKTESFKLMWNPDVTVRARGVMEKCTYCVQRINRARIEAKKDNRAIREGEIVTACQAVCPTEAIVFGDINDPNSKVSKLKSQPHDYGLLTYLNTRPRTTYLARLRNPNPELLALERLENETAERK